MVLIPVVLFAFDASTLYMGQTLNQQICKDAARAAANGPPRAISPTLTPKMRAETVIRKTQKTEGAIRINPNPTVTENITRLPTARFGGMVEGSVTVTTEADVYPPFLLRFFQGGGSFKLSCTQTFPFTYVMAANFSSAPSSVPAPRAMMMMAPAP